MPDHSDERPDLDRIERISPARRDAVRTWLTTPLADCAVCSHPVFPTSPRSIDANSKALGHLDCLQVPLSECSECHLAITSLQPRETVAGQLFHGDFLTRMDTKMFQEVLA